MNDSSLPIGVIPNQFWPAPESNGHAQRVYINAPSLHVLLDTYTKPTRSPLHVHTHTDRFVFVAHGSLSLISKKTYLEIHEKEAIILPAQLAHGFLVKDHASLISILIGSSVSQSISRLPPDLCERLHPHASSLHLPSWPFSHSIPLYQELEQETILWAQAHLKSSPSTSTCPIDLTLHNNEPIHHLDAWKTPHAFILKTTGYSYGFTYHLEPGNEFLKINRVSTIKQFLDQSDQKVPRLH